MLTLIYKVLVIVLLHSLKSTTQTSTLLYPSTYWKTTYVTDKVPDYWNHGIYAPKLPKSEKDDIFSAWLIKTTTESHSQITQTDIEDYDIEIVKTSTDKVFSINNAEIEKQTETLKADLAAHTTMPKTNWTELISTVPSVIKRTAEIKTNSIIINSIVTTTPPTSERNNFIHPEHETTIDDYDDSDDDFFMTLTPSVIIRTSTSESISNSIITKSTYTTAPTKSEKSDFTRPEFETSLDDDDDTNSPLITVNKSTITSAEKSISDSIYITTTPKSKKKDFTRPEYETTIDEDDTHPPYIIMNPNVTSTQASTSKSIIIESKTTQTTVVDVDAHPISTTMTLTSTTPYETTFDYATHPNTTRITQQTSSPEYDTIFFYYDANLNNPQKYSTLEFDTKVLDDKSPISTRMMQQTSTSKKLSKTMSQPTSPDHDTKNDDNQANYIAKIMRLPSISFESKFAAPPKRARMTRKIPKYDPTMYARTKRTKKKLSKTMAQPTSLDHDTKNDDNQANYIAKIMTLPSISSESKFAAHPKRARMTQKIPKYDPTMYARTKRIKNKLSKTMTQSTSPDHDNQANYIAKIMTLPSISSESKFAAHPKRARMTRKIPKYARTKRTKNKLSKTTRHISSPKAYPAPVIRAVNKEGGSDQFSVFLRKLLIILSVKRLEDLPLLINQFKEYLWMLLTDGQVGKLGLHINSFLAQKVMVLDNWPVKPIREFFDTLQKKLGNRNRELPKDLNDILNYMDDTYDEAEEEAMQAVLHEASLFPNSKNNNKIAQGFVDYVFLHPMQRVMGTTRGNVLFGMITEALKLRDPFKEEHKMKQDFRKKMHFGKIRKHLRQLSDINSDEPLVNKSYKRKCEDSEDKSDSNSDNLSEKFKTVKSPNGVNENEHNDETDDSKETVESKYYGYKNNVNIVARNGAFQHRQQHRAFTNENKVRKSFSKLRSLRYLMKTKLRTLDNNEEIPQHLPRKHSRQTTANRASFHETTDSSNIEMELKAKIYETFRQMNLVDNNPSRRMRQDIKSPVNVKDDSYEETDVERVLKNNIYKAVKKLLN